MAPMDLAAAVRHKAKDLGLDLVGITTADPLGPEHVRCLEAWLQAGYAGPLSFMRGHLDRRTDPGQLLPGARSVIAVGLNYKPPTQSIGPPRQGAGRVAHYALYEDYHGFLKARLHELADWIRSGGHEQARFKVCVDSSPLLERALAVRAGLGFIARNHMLTHARLGPQVFLGELITTLDLAPDEPGRGGCGTCDLCIRACPTGALRPDGFLDAGRCINTLTIEQADEIPADLAALIGDRVYGCDECVQVCPFQRQAPVCANPAFRFHPDRAWLGLSEILAMTGESFSNRFAGSPILRAGLERIQRNARVCLGNALRGHRPAGLR